MAAGRLPFRAELVGAEVVVLVELVYAGRTFYFAERAIDVTTDDGDMLPFAGGLSAVEWEESFDLIAESPAERQVSLSVLFPDGFDVAEHVTWGHDLRAATATVSLLVVGQTYENRRVIVSGVVREPEYETADDPVSCTVEDNPWLDTGRLLDADAIVSDTTWPNHTELSNGQYYPLVFGAPGRATDADGASKLYNATPVHFVDTTSGAFVLLVAGHRVLAPNVVIHTADGATNSWPVTHGPDLLGRTCALVEGYALPVGVTSEEELWAHWPVQGAMPAQDGTSLLTRGGDLAQMLLARTSLPVDTGRWSAVARALNSYRFAGYIDEQQSAWDWLIAELLPLLPVSILAGDDGLYPLAWRKTRTVADALEHLAASPGFERDGPITYEAFEPVNEITIAYARRGDDGEFQRHRTIVGVAPDLDDKDQLANLYSRTSRRRYGAGLDEVESAIVWETTTADAILGWLSRARGLSYRVVTYTADLVYAWLQLGDCVTITDADVALDEEVAIVRGLSWRGGALSVELLLVDDPARNPRL